MLIKKNCDFGFIIFFKFHCNNIILRALYSISKLFYPTNKIVLTLIEKKSKKIGNWKCLQTVQNKSKYLTCIENALWKLHVSVIICFRATLKTKIDFVENRICVKIPVLP